MSLHTKFEKEKEKKTIDTMRLRACINYNKSSESGKHVLLQMEKKSETYNK